MSPVAPAIHMEGIDKSFGAIKANRGASLEVTPGEIHALVGENGAGKSTLMRILGGLMKPDAGKVEVNGHDVTGWSTNDAISAGIGIVHQHFMLVPTLTVAENLILGCEPKTRAVVLDHQRAREDVRKLSSETGLTIEPERLVSELSVGQPLARTPAADTLKGLTVENLSVIGSRGVRVVDDVSFSVKPGEILGIAGV